MVCGIDRITRIVQPAGRAQQRQFRLRQPGEAPELGGIGHNVPDVPEVMVAPAARIEVLPDPLHRPLFHALFVHSAAFRLILWNIHLQTR